MRQVYAQLSKLVPKNGKEQTKKKLMKQITRITDKENHHIKAIIVANKAKIMRLVT